MPFPASQEAMRKHYNPMWGRGADGELIKFKVNLEYSYRVSESWSCEVLAADEDEAVELAEDDFNAKCPGANAEHCEIGNSTAKPIA